MSDRRWSTFAHFFFSKIFMWIYAAFEIRWATILQDLYRTDFMLDCHVSSLAWIQARHRRQRTMHAVVLTMLLVITS